MLKKKCCNHLENICICSFFKFQSGSGENLCNLRIAGSTVYKNSVKRELITLAPNISASLLLEIVVGEKFPF